MIFLYQIITFIIQIGSTIFIVWYTAKKAKEAVRPIVTLSCLQDRVVFDTLKIENIGVLPAKNLKIILKGAEKYKDIQAIQRLMKSSLFSNGIEYFPPKLKLNFLIGDKGVFWNENDKAKMRNPPFTDRDMKVLRFSIEYQDFYGRFYTEEVSFDLDQYSGTCDEIDTVSHSIDKLKDEISQISKNTVSVEIKDKVNIYLTLKEEERRNNFLDRKISQAEEETIP